MASERDLIADVLEAENQVLSEFSEVWDVARRNSELTNPTKQWTPEEQAKITKQGRIPYVFDKMSHPINILLGTQRDTRTDIKFREKKDGDAHRVELANAYWDYAANLYDYQHVESDVFQDGIVARYGVFGIEIDRTKDYRGNVRVTRVPYDELIWDLNYRQYDLSDAEWQSRLRWYPKDSLKKKYPDQEGAIDLMGMGEQWTGLTKEKIEYWFDREKDLVATREFFIRSWKTKYLIWRVGTAEPDTENVFETKKEAEDFLADKLAMMQAEANRNPEFAMRLIQNGGIPQFDIIDVPYQVVNRSEITLNTVLQEEEEFAPCRFPNIPYFAYFHDGDFWTAVDRIKDPQRFINRLYSQVDYLIGTQSKGALRHSPNMNKNQKKNIRDNWGKTGFVFEGKAGDVELIQGNPPPFQYFQTIDRVEVGIENNFGGANNLGMKQTASESGRAVLARQAQAGLDNFIPLDNLKRSKQNLGELILWYITNQITAPRQLRLEGDGLQMMEYSHYLGGDFQASEFRPNVGYLTLNTSENNSLENIEADVVIDEAPHSTTKKQAILNQVADAAKGGMPIPPPQVMMKLLELPISFQQEWLKSIQEQSQTPPPDETKVSVNFKDLPLSAQAQQLQKMGFNVEQSDLLINALRQPEIVGNITKMMTERERNNTKLTADEMKMAGRANSNQYGQ